MLTYQLQRRNFKEERAIALGNADFEAGLFMTTTQVFSAVTKQRAKRVGKAEKTTWVA